MNAHRRSINFSAHKGVTLLDLLLALSVVLVIVVVVLLSYQRTMTDANNQALEQSVDQVFAAVHALYPTQSYSTVSGNVLARSGKITANLVDATQHLISPWGAPIDIQPSSLTGPYGSSFDLVLHAAPTTSCTDIVLHAAPQVLRVSIGTTVLQDQTAEPPVHSVDVIQATQACAASSLPDITFTST